MNLTVLIEGDEHSEMLVGSVPAIRSAYTQGASTAELLANMREVLEMLREEGMFDAEGGFTLCAEYAATAA
ncbi:type II toxin-antitoxin system HicB family antitoxin [Roseateles noduli]|uniref:type II toxin-antitoxin system HicB family antitoxin n=1 Tax=Roseateles noduli TaxID=2052484 RepID=UPI003D656120